MNLLKNKKGKPELISVFTVNWNGRKWLEKFLISLQKQTYTQIEIIVVDNASTDDSISYIEKYFPEVKIIKNKKNVGLACATNIGVSHSSGEYVLFMNNDAWVEPDFIREMYSFYKQHDYTVISAREERYSSSTYFTCNTTIDPLGSPAYFKPTHSRKDKLFYLTVCFFCSKSDFAKTKGLDDDFFMYYEDVDWFWRLQLLGKKFTVKEDSVIHHAGAGSTGSGLKYQVFLWRNQNALQMLLKNYGAVTLIVVLPLYIMQNILELFFFLIILKPAIAYSYIEGWIFNIKHMNKTVRKREWIQCHRQVNDWTIFKKMYIGPGKFLLLKDYLSVS